MHWFMRQSTVNMQKGSIVSSFFVMLSLL